MKLLIFGGTSMFGHTLFTGLFKNPLFDVYTTVRKAEDKFYFPEFVRGNIFVLDNVLECASLKYLFSSGRFDAVINCIGLISHNKSFNYNDAYLLNAYFPKKLSEFSEFFGFRLILISTDCVYSGSKGNYTESDIPDAETDYGKSKIAGETLGTNNLIIRTSLIGLELKEKMNLLEWFLTQEKTCVGYRKAYFSGLTTEALKNILCYILTCKKDLKGILHVSSDRIDKFSLLKLIAKYFEKPIELIPNDSFKIDRSLNGSLFDNKVGYEIPKWDEMIKKLAAKERDNV